MFTVAGVVAATEERDAVVDEEEEKGDCDGGAAGTVDGVRFANGEERGEESRSEEESHGAQKLGYGFRDGFAIAD